MQKAPVASAFVFLTDDLSAIELTAMATSDSDDLPGSSTTSIFPHSENELATMSGRMGVSGPIRICVQEEMKAIDKNYKITQENMKKE